MPRSAAAQGPTFWQHLWILAGLLAFAVALTYAPSLPGLQGLAEHAPSDGALRAIARAAFFLPVLHACFMLSTLVASMAIAASAAAMLPSALAGGARRTDDLFELGCFVVVSGAMVVWTGTQRRERRHRQEMLEKLETARRELIVDVELIRRSERRLVTINQVCAAVSQSMDLNTGLQWTLERVSEEMRADAALFFLMDEGAKRLTLAAACGAPEEVAQGGALAMGEGHSGLVAAAGKAAVIDSAPLDLSNPRSPARYSQLIVPIRTRDRVTGTLCVAARGKRRFTQDEVELLTALGNQVGFSVENVRLYQHVKASEARYRDLFENATVPVFIHDLEGRITDANAAFAALTGYGQGELISMRAEALLSPEGRAVMEEAERRLLAGDAASPEAAPQDVALRHRDGTRRVVSMPVRLIRYEGRPTGFQHFAIDMTERRKMQQDLRYYLSHVLTAQEDERQRISRELHDDTAQSLLLISHRLDSLTSDPGVMMSTEERTQLLELRGLVVQTLADLRRLTQDLRPRILDDLGLIPALEWLADDLQKQRAIHTRVEVAGAPRRLTPEVELLAFRIAQEAVRNVRKHSEASACAITLTFDAGSVLLSVDDNGKGFELPQDMTDMANRGKLGLLGMQERAVLLGGALSVRSAPGAGTTVSVRLPG